MTSNGVSRSEAKLDTCRAFRDGKLRARYRVERVQTPHRFDVDLRAVGQPRSRFDQRDIIGRPRVPPDLIPDDVDWKNSRPKSPWLDNRGFLVGIARIEFSTTDVIRVLCRGRTGRPASDAAPRGSSAGIKVHVPEPASPPQTDAASEDQVAGPEGQGPEPASPPETEVALTTPVPPPRHKRAAKRDRAKGAVDDIYPGGVPEEIADIELFQAVGRKLGPDTPSRDTVLRAAGRRSK
jgi:hypothetical protein